MNNLFNITIVDYDNNTGIINNISKTPPYDKKSLPMFDNKIFKALSNTKPYCNSLFAYAEVYWSHLINKYFSNKTPLYSLAICKNINKKDIRKQEVGVLVEAYLSDKEKSIPLSEYYSKHPEEKVEEYINYCEKLYDYRPIFETNLFKNNRILGEQLAFKVLISILTRDQNFHYDNNNLIYKDNKIISLNPVIDNEFSSIFLKLDRPNAHKTLMEIYDLGMDTSIIPPYKEVSIDKINNLDLDDLLLIQDTLFKYKNLFLNIHSKELLEETDKRTVVGVYEYLFYKDCLGQSTQKKNIKYITEHYPDVCKNFLTSLDIMLNELKYIDIPKDNFNLNIDSHNFYKWHNYLESLGKELNKYRINNNLSYEEIANLLGTTSSYIESIETNPIHTPMSEEMHNKLHNLLNLKSNPPKDSINNVNMNELFKEIIDETISSGEMLKSTIIYYLNKAKEKENDGIKTKKFTSEKS